MPPANPAEKLKNAPLADLVGLLLKQFQRLLSDRGLALTTAQIADIGEHVEKRQPLSAEFADVVRHLGDMVTESVDELQTRFGLSFAQSLHTQMDAIGGWETTGEFLELANHKSNAELRISAGSTLLVMLAEADYVPYLLAVIEADDGIMDVDAALAQRALCHLAGVTPHAEDWLAQIVLWWQDQVKVPPKHSS